MRTLLLDHEAVAAHADLPAVIDAVEAAFAAYALGDAVMPAKSYVDLPAHDGDFRSMPAYVDTSGVGDLERPPGSRRDPTDVGDWEAASLKWVNVHPNNRERFDLPTVMGTLVYSDPRNGFPLAVMDGTELTTRRTGAAAAVATDHLAVPDADTMGIVGAGAQADAQFRAVSAVRPIDEVVVADRNPERVAAFADAHGDAVDVRGGSITEAGHCDVLSTLTPSREPVVGPGDLGEHTHVNAVGADAAGKQELDPEILRAAKLVVDDYEQTTHSGEINVPWAAGELADADLHGELGDVVLGRVPGRTGADGVTVFDSTGLAIQDAAAAHVAYASAADAGVGTVVDLVGA